MVRAKASTGASKSNGGAMFYARNNGQDYDALYKRMNKTYTKRQGIDGALSYVNQKGLDNLIKLMKLPPETALSKDHEDLVNIFSQSENMPKIFALGGKDGDQYVKNLSREEYIKAFIDWARENGQETNIEGLTRLGIDNTGMFDHNSTERTQLADGTMSGFGWGQDVDQDYNPEYTSLEEDGYEFSANSKNRKYKGEFKFQEDLAAEQAGILYDLQRKMVNQTLNGALNRVNEEMYNEGDKAKPYIKMFDEANVNSVMLGISDANMSAGDVEISPTTSVMFDPLMLTEEGVDMIGNLSQQIQNTDSRQLFYLEGNFIAKEKGDYNIAELIEETQDEDGDERRRFVQNYLSDVIRMQAKGATKSNYPKAKISYTNNIVDSDYLEDSDEDPNRIGMYKIEFGPDFLDQYGDKKKMEQLGISESTFKDIAKNGIMIGFESDNDKSPYKYGEYNFSSVATEITTSANHAYEREISRGGSVNVQRDQNGQYIASYEPLLYNSQTGQYDALPRQYMNLGGDRYGIDEQINKLLDGIRVIQQKNIQREMSTKKANR